MGQASNGGRAAAEDGGGLRRAARLGLAASAAAGLAAVHVALREYAFDDAYIHFRIARNLVETGRPHFNPGEAVAVGSSPGWALLLAAASIVTPGGSPALPAVAAVGNALATLAGAVLHSRLLRQVSGAPAGVAFVFALAYVGSLLPASVGLMETPVALLLAGLGLRALAADDARGFAWLAASCFFRPELVVLAALALAVTCARGAPALRAAVPYAIAGAAPFAAWSLLSFGTLVPQAVRAKALVYDVPAAWVASTAAASLTPAVELGPVAYDPDPRFSLAVVVALVAAACGVLSRRRGAASPAVAAALAAVAWGPVLLTLYVGARTFLFPWYVPLYAVPVLFAAAVAAAGARRPVARLAVLLLAAPLLVKVLWIPQAALAAGRSPAAWIAFEEGARVRHYVAVGRELARRYPGETLLAPEIGGLGWGFDGRLLDAVGLATPGALAFHPMRVPEERSSGLVGAIPPGLVARERPGLVVAYDAFAEAFLGSSAAAGYRLDRRPLFLGDDLRRTATRTFWGSRHLNVLVREDLAGAGHGGAP